MRQKSKEVALLAISLLMLASCNEKISAELQSGSTVTPPTVAPTSFSFKVVETSNVNLGYSLHQTGAGNKNKSCEITRDTVAFTNDDFLGNLPAYDVTCYLDAEELALYNSGMKFKVEASPNACEFVGYQPFSFFNRMPGDSSADFRLVTCGAGITDGDAASSHRTWGAGATAGRCGEYIDQTMEGGSPVVPVASKRPITLASASNENELCRYDYSQTIANGENCDIGVINIQEINITLDATTGLPVNSTTTREIQCGGEVVNCVKGPIKKETTISQFTSGTVVTEVPEDQAHSNERVFPGLITEQRTKNIEYVNYRRFLASTVVDFWNPLVPAYRAGAFLTGTSVDTNFEPEVMRMYALNLRMDGLTSNNDPAAVRAQAGAVVGYATKPLSSEPFVGFYDYSSADPNEHYDFSVNPYYTFSCLDNAFETTARIRIVVRDWDRIFDKNASYMETLSDYDYGSNARQDRRYFVFDPSNFNNMQDWDDILQMTRRDGAYDPSLTWWAPRNAVFSRMTNRPALNQWNFPGNL